MAGSRFGRVPDETLTALRNHLRDAAAIVDRTGLTGTWSEAAYRILLVHLLQDWAQNSDSELLPRDVEDLGNLLAAAATVAREQPLLRRDTAFERAFDALLDDWVQNWNTDGA